MRQKILKENPDADVTHLICRPHYDNGNHPSMSGWFIRDARKWARFWNNMCD